MQSKAIRKTKRAIRRIKRINKENVHGLKWCKGKVKVLEEELASKKKWVLMYAKLVPNGEDKLKILEQRVIVLEQRAKANKNGNKTRTQTKS